jgi:ERCC4-type nuclease
MSQNHWPHNHKSGVVANEIDWVKASPLAFHASQALWRRVSKKNALALIHDPKTRGIFTSLPADVQLTLTEIAEGEDNKRKAAAAVKEQKQESEKEDILRRINEGIQEAEEAEDLQAKFKGLEMLAKVQQLLTTKPQEDPTIIIQVITGVTRAAEEPAA